MLIKTVYLALSTSMHVFSVRCCERWCLSISTDLFKFCLWRMNLFQSLQLLFFLSS